MSKAGCSTRALIAWLGQTGRFSPVGQVVGRRGSHVMEMEEGETALLRFRGVDISNGVLDDFHPLEDTDLLRIAGDMPFPLMVTIRAIAMGKVEPGGPSCVWEHRNGERIKLCFVYPGGKQGLVVEVHPPNEAQRRRANERATDLRVMNAEVCRGAVGR